MWYHTPRPIASHIPTILISLFTNSRDFFRFFFNTYIYFPKFTVNVLILVLLAVAFLIIVQRNLLNLSDFLHKENPGMFLFLWDGK